MNTITALGKFNRDNWYIYPIFLIALWGFWYLDMISPGETTVFFIGNLIADLLVIMFLYWDQKWDHTKSIYAWIGSIVIFGAMALWTSVFDNQHQYLLAQVIFMIAFVNLYLRHMTNKNFQLSPMFTSVLAGMVYLLGMYFWVEISASVQYLGLLLFPLVLTYPVQGRKRGTYILMALSLMLLGTLIEVFVEFQQGHLHSFLIVNIVFPLTVLIAQIRNMKHYEK